MSARELAEPEQLELPDAVLLVTPVEGWCPYCPHRLDTHLRGRLTCLHSTPTLTWACPCSGPGGDPPGIPT